MNYNIPFLVYTDIKTPVPIEYQGVYNILYCNINTLGIIS